MKRPLGRDSFGELVREALETLPGEFKERLVNVQVVIEDEPTAEQLEGAGLDPGEDTLFGLYEGTPLSEREHNFGMVLPDRITIFYRPLVESFDCPAAIRREIRTTVIHEIAHFFGMEDNEIEDLGY